MMTVRSPARETGRSSGCGRGAGGFRSRNEHDGVTRVRGRRCFVVTGSPQRADHTGAGPRRVIVEVAAVMPRTRAWTPVNMGNEKASKVNMLTAAPSVAPRHAADSDADTSSFDRAKERKANSAGKST